VSGSKVVFAVFAPAELTTVITDEVVELALEILTNTAFETKLAVALSVTSKPTSLITSAILVL